MIPSLNDLRIAWFGAGPDETVSDAEYRSLDAAVDAGQTLSNVVATSPSSINGGAQTVPREQIVVNNITLTPSTMFWTFFTAPRSFTATRMKLITGGTAAGATPTLCRAGVYEVAPVGDLALVASIPNDTTLFAATNTEYLRNLSAPYSVVAGKRLAIGMIVVTAAAAPTFNGVIHPQASGPLNKVVPQIATFLGGQADLPANTTIGAQNGAGQRIYSELLPA